MLVIGPSEGGSRPWSLLESHLPTLSGGAGGTISGVSECDTNYIHNICHILRAYDNISCIVDKKPWSALEYLDIRRRCVVVVKLVANDSLPPRGQGSEDGTLTGVSSLTSAAAKQRKQGIMGPPRVGCRRSP
jgi:hypothetical protein